MLGKNRTGNPRIPDLPCAGVPQPVPCSVGRPHASAGEPVLLGQEGFACRARQRGAAASAWCSGIPSPCPGSPGLPHPGWRDLAEVSPRVPGGPWHTALLVPGGPWHTALLPLQPGDISGSSSPSRLWVLSLTLSFPPEPVGASQGFGAGACVRLGEPHHHLPLLSAARASESSPTRGRRPPPVGQSHPTSVPCHRGTNPCPVQGVSWAVPRSPPHPKPQEPLASTAQRAVPRSRALGRPGQVERCGGPQAIAGDSPQTGRSQRRGIPPTHPTRCRG